MRGPYDHGIIATKNRALSLGADMMVAGKMGEYKVGTAENKITISHLMLNCTDALIVLLKRKNQWIML